MLNKIVEYNSSTSQEIVVSYVKALKSFERTQVEITTLTDAPAIIAPKCQPIVAPTQTTGGATTINEEQAGEHNKAEVAYIAEANPSTKDEPEGIGQDETQA